MDPPAKQKSDLASPTKDVLSLSLFLSFESDDFAVAFQRVESLNFLDLQQLITSIFEVCLLLDLPLLECSHMVKSGPYDLLFDEKVIVCCEETVQILAELTLKKEDFEDNLLFQATAYISDNAGLERLF